MPMKSSEFRVVDTVERADLLVQDLLLFTFKRYHRRDAKRRRKKELEVLMNDEVAGSTRVAAEGLGDIHACFRRH